MNGLECVCPLPFLIDTNYASPDDTKDMNLFSALASFGETVKKIFLSNTNSTANLISNEMFDYKPNEIQIGITKTNWLNNFQRKIIEIRKLSDNWNGYGSKAPNATALRASQDIFDSLHKMDFAPTKVAPSAEDGVSIIFVNGDKRAMIECYNDGDIVAAIYTSYDEPKVWIVENYAASIEIALYDIESFLR